MTTFQVGSLIIQGAVAVFLAATFIVYFLQLKAMRGQLETMEQQLKAARKASEAENTLTLIRYLQDSEVREARVWVRDHRHHMEQHPKWWERRDERQASLVASSFDMAGLVCRNGLVPVELITESWGFTIIDCYSILEDYIVGLRKGEHSGPQYWSSFEWLYQQAVSLQDYVGFERPPGERMG